MAEKALATAKASETKQKCSNSCKQNTSMHSLGSTADMILKLQRSAGNQAVQKLIKSRALQAKLRVGQPNDIYEQEADRVAEQVMRMTEPLVSNKTKVSNPAYNNSIQRKCPGCKKGTKMEKEEEDEKLQKKEASGLTPEVTPKLESSISALHGGGQPLHEATRAFFEPRFGADFGQVRVHTGSHAAETAKSINARAFTVGNNITFGGGQFAPGSHEGRKLLAHELTHTIQQGATGSVARPKNIMGSYPIISRSAMQLARDTLDAGVSTASVVAGASSADQVMEALSKVNPVAGVGDYPEVFRILQSLSAGELLTTLNELDRRYQLDNIKFYIGAATVSRERIEASILAVMYKNRGTLSDSEVTRIRTLIPALDPADQEAIKSFVGEQSFEFLKGEWHGGESDFTIHAGEDDFIISFEMWLGTSATEADGTVMVSPVRISDAFQSEIRYWDYRGMPVEKGEEYTSMGSWSVPASPFQQKVKFNRAKFEPVLLKELPEAKASVWTFDWNGDGQPDFGLRIEYSISNIFREYKLTTRDINKTSQVDFHFVQPDAWKFGYMGNIAPPIKKDDLEFWKSITETAITLIPVVGEVVLLAEAITGRNIFGDKMSTTERAINGIAALLPVAGGLVAKGFAKEGAELAKVAAKLGRSEEEVLDLLRAIDKEGAEAEKFARWRDKLKAGGKLTAEEAIEVRSLIQQIDIDVRVSRAGEQKFTREIKGLGVTDETVKMLEKNPELGRALLENSLAAEALSLCKSFCIPEFATPGQVKRLNKLLADLEKEGVKIDKVKLKEYLHSKKDVVGLGEAIDRLADTSAGIKEHRIKAEAESLIDVTETLEQHGIREGKPVDIRLAEAKYGQKLDVLEGQKYPTNQVPIFDNSGSLRRLDSYDPLKGEIISRKSLVTSNGQIAFADEFTMIDYFQEFALKYPDGATIANVPSARKMLVNGKPLAGQTLTGKYILEVPVQKYAIPDRIMTEARNRHITIRDINGKTY